MGEEVGLLLRRVQSQELARGQVLPTPGTVSPRTKFKAKIYMLSKEEGGRHTPFFTGYKPQFYLRTADLSGVVKLPAGVEMVMPGANNVVFEVELSLPIAVEKGLRFTIREGKRVVGGGTITEIIE